MRRLAKHGHRLRGTAVALSAALAGGCIHYDDITMRPEYAFPQNLVSLCSGDSTISVNNRGSFVTGNYTNGTKSLLLSMQLQPGDPAEHRLYTTLELDVSRSTGISIRAGDERGWKLLETIPAQRLRCDETGELVMEYADDSFYFWASVGTKSRSLALWSNVTGDLVLQNRWREAHKGLVSGAVSGDGWALFQAQEFPADATISAPTAAALASCATLAGDYWPTAEVVHVDGSLGQRLADDQFFRTELIGEHPVNQGNMMVTRLGVAQDGAGGITLSLYDDDELLGSRDLPADSLKCVDGRWEYRGKKKLASAWLLFAAAGGVYWEDLSLWRDRNGALLVTGEYVSRGVLFLIPIDNSQTLFMAFPSLE